MITCTTKVFGSQTAKVGLSKRFQKSHTQSAFTLIELSVVIVIIAILAGLLLPALNRSQARAQAIMCMNNSRHLALAWTMYSGDNNDRLAYNLSSSPRISSSSLATTPNWVNNFMDWEITPGDTNMGFINQSILAPYEHSPRIFSCPSDHTVSPVQRAAGWSSRARSVSMNAMVGDPGNNGNIYNPGYQQFIRENDFRDPSGIFVFLDEHPDSIDDGYFLVDGAAPLEWMDLPASYHNGGGSFSFADGHTEIHRWQSGKTIQPAQADVLHLPMLVDSNDSADLLWVIRHESFANQ